MINWVRLSLLRRVEPVFAALITMLVAFDVVLSVPASAADEVFASVGTGELNGIYYPVGKAICQIVNRDLSKHGVRCSPEATPGSVYNVDAIQSGELEFGIVQSDVHFVAYKGEGAWAGRSFIGLRSVLSLYPELVTVMARADLRIQDLAGLVGRRVNVGSRGTGTRATWDTIEEQIGWRDEERVHPVELRADATASALCGGTIDAGMLIVGHPSPLVKTQQAAWPSIWSRSTVRPSTSCSTITCIINAEPFRPTSTAWRPMCRPLAGARPW